MAKLSKIFESINHTKTYESQKKTYLTKKLVESYMLSEGLTHNGVTTDLVVDKLISEAIKYGNEAKAIAFLKDVEKEAINEGFLSKIGSGLKKAATWAKDKVKGAINAVKNFFSGNKVIEAAFDKFHSEIKPAYEILKSADGKQTSIEDKTEDTKLLNSLEVTSDYSYLFEGDTPPAEGETTTPESGEDADADAGVAAMASYLFNGKKVDTGKKTGSTQQRVKFYAITKSGVNSTLWVGPSNNISEMKVLMSYMKSSNKLFMNLSTDVVATQLEMELIANLLLAIKNNQNLNPDGAYREVTQAGKKVVLDQSGKKWQLIPGKLVIMSIGGKSKLPLKLKKAVQQEQFMGVLGIKKQEGEVGQDTEVVANNNKKVDGKPVFKEAGHENETQEEFEDRMTAWSDAEDNKDFGDDDETNDYLVDLEGKINQFFGMNHEDLIDNKLDDVVDTIFEKTPVKIDDINEYNDNIATVLEYYAGTDKKLTPEQITSIAGDLTAITEVSYPKVIARSMAEAKTPEEKQAIVDRGLNLVMELQKIAGAHGVKFPFNKEAWKEVTGELQLKDIKDETNYGSTEAPKEDENVEDDDSKFTPEQQKMIDSFIDISTTFGIPARSLTNAQEVLEEYDIGNTNLTNEMVQTFVRYLDEIKENGTLKDSAVKFNKFSPEQRAEAIIKIAGEFKNKEDAPVQEETVDSPEKWMKAVINNSGVKNSIDEALLTKLEVDKGSLWANFGKFAKEHNNDLAEIFLATNFGGDHKPMTDNEFLAYATGVDKIASYAQKAVSSDKLDSQGHDKTAFNNFLVTATSAATTLNKTINPANLGAGVSGGGSKSDNVQNTASGTTPTTTNQTTPETSTPTELEKPKADPYEAFLKQIETDSPELSETLKTLDEASKKVWAKEIVKLNKAGVSYDNINEYIKTAPEFFNRKKLKIKIDYLKKLSSKNIPMDIRIKALTAMKEEDVLDSFDSIDIFNNVDGEVYKTGNFVTDDNAKNTIFSKSKF